MQLGWIDFSKNERNKVLGVLDSLSESGTLDELGIAPIRDGFADLFFPGTSTLQTHAKYFLLVPYACKDLERSKTLNPKTAYERLYEIERSTAEILRENSPKESHIIGGGRDYINKREWIKRPPSVLYWAGLRRYGIFNGSLSLSEYLKAVCALKKDKDASKKTGNRNDNEDCDDKDAGAVEAPRFFPLPTYRPDWKEDLTIQLTKEEAVYLKNRIRCAAPDSLLVYLLNSKNEDIFKCDSFEALSAIVEDETLKADCEMAVGFSKFLCILRAVYNLVVSKGKNKEANRIIDELHPVRLYSDIDINAIFSRFKITNSNLYRFLLDSKGAMAQDDIESLKRIVTNREKSIKGAERAKTMNPGSFDETKWFGGKPYLDYRLEQVQQILKDIFDGEADNV